MKNDKFPLKERYNNFIQKHPKFWLTLIYVVLMLALAVTMLITVLTPPNNKTASANYQAPSECPNLDYYNYYYQENDITPEIVTSILSGLPVGNYRYVTCPTTFALRNVSANGSTYLTYYAFRYIVCYRLMAGSFELCSFYFSNSNADPISNGQPSDAIIIATNRFPPSHYDFSRADNFIINTNNFRTISYFPILFNHYKYFNLSDLCDLGGSCSPDDLKAEYDKGHADGYEDGYNKGKLDGTTVDLNPISIFLEPVSAFMNIKLFGFVSLGLVFNIVLFVSLAIIFIKLFAGG